MSVNPYLFAVGCPRSGTTLLQRMLDHHPMLTVSNDTHFIPLVIEDVEIDVDPPLTSALVDRVLTYRRFHRLGLPAAVVHAAAVSAPTYSTFVSALYSELGRQHRKPLAGEKTPDYVKYLPRLHTLFPWVRTIHIIRDGRDVALSALEWARDGKGPSKLELWPTEPVAVCALWWQWQVGMGRRDGMSLGPTRYREVAYEDLIAEPEAALRELAEFLELPFAPEMLAYYEGKVQYNLHLSAKSAWLPPTRGLRDWRTHLKSRDLQLFEALAGDLLSRLGYERGADTISAEVAELAERYRTWWEADRARRLAKARKRRP
jgi:hypothetical protein